MTPNNNTHLNNSTEFDTTDIDFNDQAVDFSSFAVPTAGETASIVGEQVAQKTGKAARIALLVTTLIAGGAALVSCDTDEPIKPGGEVVTIDRKTDNPAHKADFMKNVRPAVLGNGVATMDFEAVWKYDKYELQPKSMVDVAKAIERLEQYASSSNTPREDLAFALYYSNGSGGSVRIVWLIPYSDLKQLEYSNLKDINLNSSDYNKYILKTDLMPNGGNPNATVAKSASGYLEINIGLAGSNKIAQEIQVISPYIFGM